MGLPGILFVLGLASAAVAHTPRTVAFPCQIGGLELSTKGGYVVAYDERNHGNRWLGSVQMGKAAIAHPFGSLAISSDERYAAGTLGNNSVELIDLATMAISGAGLWGPCAFAPEGHLLASRLSSDVSSGDPSVMIYDLDSRKFKTLAMFVVDMGGRESFASLMIRDWTDDGILLNVSYGGALDRLHILNPKTDHAERASLEYGAAPYTTVDGSSVQARSKPEGMELVARGPDGFVKPLLDKELAGEPLRSLVFAGAAKANRMLVWSVSDTPNEQSLWYLSTATRRATRVLQLPYTPGDPLRFAISGNGASIAYRDPNDPMKAIVMPAPFRQ